MLRAVIATVVLAGCVAACRYETFPSGPVAPARPKRDTLPPPASWQQTAPDRPLTFTAADGPVVLGHGYATLDDRDGLTLVLTEEPLGCGDLPAASSYYAKLHIPAGPDGNYFAGHAIGVDVELFHKTRIAAAEATFVNLALQPFDAKQDAPLHGWLTLEWAQATNGSTQGGTFDVAICRDARGAPAILPENAQGPAVGELAGTPVKFQSAIARMFSAHGTQGLASLQLFTAANVGCDGGPATLSLVGLPGTAGRFSIVGFRQPVREVVLEAGSASHWDAWVRFDAIELRPGAIIVGAFAAKSGRHAGVAGSAHGEVHALVCAQ